MLLDRNKLDASVCRDDFFWFLQRFWSVVVQEKPVWNWHIEYLCRELQEAGERVIRGEPKQHDLVINIPPGTTKSTIVSVMFPAWMWIRMPHCKIISVSHTHKLAVKLARYTRDVVLSEKWTSLFGPINLREDQNAKSFYENMRGGWRYAVGVDGSVIGQHAHLILIDDPIDPNEAISELELANANRVVMETLPTRKVDKEITFTTLVMQRLHQNDPSALFLEEAKKEDGTPVRHIRLPGEVVVSGLKEVRPRKLAAHYVDGLLDPVRLNRKVLRNLHTRLGEYGYAGQILQNPVPIGGGMFKTERIQIDDPPPLRHFKALVRYWDKAGTQAGGAYTVGALLGRDAHGRFWVLDVVRGQWDPQRREATILQTAQLDTDRVKIGIEQEPGSGGKESAESTVRNLAGFRVRVDPVKGDKVYRADPFSVQVNGGNVRMRKADWNSEFIEEMRHFPLSKYKDQVDAASGAFAMLVKKRKKVGGMW